MSVRRWQLAHGRHLDLGDASVIMGILNVTPDSFSDGGRFDAPSAALDQARRMADEGAAIIDVGGESTRPGAEPVSAEEEQRRVLPVIEALTRIGILVSVDTYREKTARLAVQAGAHIVNDVWGLSREPGIARVAAQTGAGLVIMHTGRDREKLVDGIADQFQFLHEALGKAEYHGVAREQIVLDPGFGFAKETVEENVTLMARMDEVVSLGYPLLVGISRKRFLGTLTGRDTAERDVATAAGNALLRLKGADIFRVHDIRASLDALQVADAVRKIHVKNEVRRSCI
ncbi:MAG: dihydropteroate synthase [Methylobacterium mesophilicum]|nr:dihydropteroate synthase [Methylobacterium mesophilicum]